MRRTRVAAPAAIVAVGLALALASVAASAFAATPSAPAGARQAAKDFTLLQAWMAGSFSSRVQAARDPAFRDLSLHIAPIWPALSAARWFYVEQAAAGRERAPDRQRVYRLSLRDDGRFECAVFKLPGSSRFVGAWRAPLEQRLARVTPDSLVQGEGCNISLRKQRDRFAGGTEGKACAAESGAAAYATSEVEVRFDRIIALDRGWDSAGKQVSGLRKGGSEFVRVPESSP